jgi:hypothetical protein
MTPIPLLDVYVYLKNWWYVDMETVHVYYGQPVEKKHI